jgi:hypothetical protein
MQRAITDSRDDEEKMFLIRTIEASAKSHEEEERVNLWKAMEVSARDSVKSREKEDKAVLQRRLEVSALDAARRIVIVYETQAYISEEDMKVAGPSKG